MTRGAITLALVDRDWAELTRALNSHVESAWVLTARLVEGGWPEGARTLLVRNCRPVPNNTYLKREADSLSIASEGWLPGFQQADVDGDIPIFVHTHPAGNATHSVHDDRVDAELQRVALNRVGSAAYASLVLGGQPEAPHFAGRMRTQRDVDWVAIDRVRVVGRNLQLLTSDPKANFDAGVFSRQVLAFGDAGQAVLRQLRVGVVGAGGTGSSVIEQLLRLGVGEIVAIDKQPLEGSNVTRVYGSNFADAGVLKVELAARQAKGIGLGTDLIAVEGTVADEAVAGTLVHCDVVFGCTDDHLGRAIITRLPIYLLQLLIDCGVVVDSRGGELHGIFGRVSVVPPLEPCLVCTGVVDATQLRNEQLAPDELRALQREGYAPELDTPDPAVVVYTTMTASAAVNELLGRLFGYIDTDSNRRLLLAHDAQVSNTFLPPVGRHQCGDARRLGFGVEPPFLGWSWPAAQPPEAPSA